MFPDHQHHTPSTNERDIHIPSWYPIHVSPSQDIWELPSSSTGVSSLISDMYDEHDLNTSVDNQRRNQGENFLAMQAEDSRGVNGSNTSIRTAPTGTHRHVLGDATNTVRRAYGSPVAATQRRVRRSRFN